MKVRTIKASALKRMAVERSWGWETNELSAEATAEVSDSLEWQAVLKRLQDELKEKITLGMQTEAQKVSMIGKLLGRGDMK